MTDLAGTGGRTEFVMREGHLAILELSGKLWVERSSAEDDEIVFGIERAEGRGGGFKITRAGFGEADWLPTREPTKALEIRMRKGNPVFSNPVFSLKVATQSSKRASAHTQR